MFNLNSDKGIQGFRRAVQEADDEGDSPFDMIEVKWPLPMLEVRMTLKKYQNCINTFDLNLIRYCKIERISIYKCYKLIAVTLQIFFLSCMM